jgi:hypothetical protein
VPGPFYFAWTAAETAFSESAHAVEDEEVFAFEIQHNEGEFATLSLDVVNPKVGLLNPGRDQWAWFSWDTGTSDGVVPLFFGRLVGVPQDMQDEVVRLQFIARPLDYETQKAGLAETLKVAPYYDPIWLSEEARLDPDSVLEARTQLWHIDRVTHDVTVSDIISGEGNTLVVNGAFFYDSLSVRYTTPPGRTCNVRAQAVWQQQAQGEIDITSEFPPYIESFSGDGLISDWPDDDTDIGGGWRFVTSDWRPYFTFSITADPFDVNFARQFDTRVGDTVHWAPGRIVPANMVVGYDANREFVETLTFSLAADVQPLLTDAGDDEILTIDLSAEVDQAIDPPTDSSGGEPTMPIGARTARRYFQTARGRESVDYLVCMARAQLIHRARAVDISFETDFANGVDLSCRDMVTIADDRLPGTTVTAKVKSYTLSLNGDQGDMVCAITLGASVGNGGTISEVAGTPVYVADGYVDEGFQVYSGATTAVVADEVTVEDYASVPINDDGVDWTALTPAAVIEGITVYNDATEQLLILEDEVSDGLAADTWEIARVFLEAYTEVELDLVSAQGGPFETAIPITTSVLKIPKQIDLEAAAA